MQKQESIKESKNQQGETVFTHQGNIQKLCNDENDAKDNLWGLQFIYA
jgi:hypothetical protein